MQIWTIQRTCSCTHVSHAPAPGYTGQGLVCLGNGTCSHGATVGQSEQPLSSLPRVLLNAPHPSPLGICRGLRPGRGVRTVRPGDVQLHVPAGARAAAGDKVGGGCCGWHGVATVVGGAGQIGGRKRGERGGEGLHIWLEKRYRKHCGLQTKALPNERPGRWGVRSGG